MTNGNCRECPEKCYWDKHSNIPYKYEYSSEEKLETFDEMKKKYVHATS